MLRNSGPVIVLALLLGFLFTCHTTTTQAYYSEKKHHKFYPKIRPQRVSLSAKILQIFANQTQSKNINSGAKIINHRFAKNTKFVLSENEIRSMRAKYLKPQKVKIINLVNAAPAICAKPNAATPRHAKSHKNKYLISKVHNKHPITVKTRHANAKKNKQSMKHIASHKGRTPTSVLKKLSYQHKHLKKEKIIVGTR